MFSTDATASLLRSRPTRRGRAFSLLEVVVAVGIFAIGMVAVLGLFAPIAKSVGSVQDAEAAANVAALVSSRLQGLPISVVSQLLKVSSGARTHQLTDADNAPNSPAADPTKDPQLIFANRDGSKIGRYDDAIWGRLDTEKFFEIALIRNETLSPDTVTTTDAEGNTVTLAADDAALFLAYTARIRWPAFVPDPTSARRASPAGSNPTGTVRFDNSKKQVLHFSGIITR
jgi:prepilin-type N-terminal cleavage/methylation domain-containing protein